MDKHYLVAKVEDLEGKSVFYEVFEVSLGDRTKEEIQDKLEEFLSLSEYTEDYSITLKVIADKDKEND